MDSDITGGVDVDARVKDRLKYRLLLLQSCRGDPLVEAEMLDSLRKAYNETGVRIPDDMKKYLDDEAKRIGVEFKKNISKKKAELRNLSRIQIKTEKTADQKPSKLSSRTELIFGRKEELNYEEALGYLNTIEQSGINLGLERISRVLSLLNNPEKGLKFVHVTGTNGKGSVCAMISSILESAGYRVGLYTSPHLCRFSERIRINGVDIPDESVVELVNFLKPYQKKFKLTFFELVTIMALLYFVEKKTDFAVLEVGLGGRLDATNVITPLVSVITNIDYEFITKRKD